MLANILLFPISYIWTCFSLLCWQGNYQSYWMYWPFCCGLNSSTRDWLRSFNHVYILAHSPAGFGGRWRPRLVMMQYRIPPLRPSTYKPVGAVSTFPVTTASQWQRVEEGRFLLWGHFGKCFISFEFFPAIYCHFMSLCFLLNHYLYCTFTTKTGQSALQINLFKLFE